MFRQFLPIKTLFGGTRVNKYRSKPPFLPINPKIVPLKISMIRMLKYGWLNISPKNICFVGKKCGIIDSEVDNRLIIKLSY